MSSVQLVVLHTQDEVDNDSSQQGNGQNSRAKSVVESALTATANTLRSPVKCDDCVDHGGHGDEGEETGRNATDAVTEVQQADGQTAQDDGEVQPGEEGSLIGEEDFRLDTGWQGDPLACRLLGYIALGLIKGSLRARCWSRHTERHPKAPGTSDSCLYPLWSRKKQMITYRERFGEEAG